MENNLSPFIEEILSMFPQEEIKSVLFDKDLTKYQKDPVGFIEKYFGVTLAEEIKELCESVRDNRITIAQSATGVGKTHSAALIAIWVYLCFPNSIVTTAAAPPERNLREKLWGEIRTNTKINSSLFGNKHKITSLKITDSDLDNHSGSIKEHFITGITIPTSGSDQEKESRVSGSHAPYQLFVLDEGDAIPDPIYKGIDGCMSGTWERLLVMFNPKRKSGAAFRMIKSGEANVIKLSAFSHPNVISGKDLIPGAVTRESTIRRINTMTSKLAPGEEPSHNTCFEVPSFLVGATAKGDGDFYYPPLESGWRRIDNQQFHYQVLGEYPSQAEDQLISNEWIDAAVTRWKLYVAKFGKKPPEGIRPIIGMDVADEGGDYNTVSIRYGGYVDEIEKWRGVDPQMSALKCAKIHAERHAIVTNAESDGLGASVAPTMGREYYFRCDDCNISYTDKNTTKCHKCDKELIQYHVDAKKVKVSSKPTKKCEFGEFTAMRDQLWWSLREWMRTDNTAMIPDDKDLIEELQIPSYNADTNIKITSKKEMRAALNRSPDKADALIQTFYSAPVPKVRVV